MKKGLGMLYFARVLFYFPLFYWLWLDCDRKMEKGKRGFLHPVQTAQEKSLSIKSLFSILIAVWSHSLLSSHILETKAPGSQHLVNSGAFPPTPALPPS